MSSVYDRVLAAREDMTDWVLHFTRDAVGQSAFCVLQSILVEGVLRSSFARRGTPARSTIYGPNAAVCFTEQPLSAFLQYLRARNDPRWMARYGLIVDKRALFDHGGLPVIYGAKFVTELDENPEGFDPPLRMLSTDSLPLNEQFRYVAFNPSREFYPLDWSHEREWRWPATDAFDYEQQNLYLGTKFSTFASDTIRCKVHAFVQLDADIEPLQHHVQAAMDQDSVGKVPSGHIPYKYVWLDCLSKMEIVSLETITREIEAGNRAFSRFESIPTHARRPLLPSAG